MDSSSKPKGGTSAKGGVNIMEGHRKRQSQGVSLRDKARKKTLEEHRSKGTFGGSALVKQLPQNVADPTQYDPNIDPEVIPLDIIPICCQAIREHGDLAVKTQCLSLLTKTMRKKAPSIAFNDILAQDIGFTVQRCCSNDMPQELFKEGVTFLSVMATGDTKATAYVITSGGVTTFGNNLDHNDPDVRAHAMSGLASLCTSAETRDLMSPYANSILQRVQVEEDEYALAQCVFFFTQFAKIKDYLHVSFYAPVVPRLTELLEHRNEKVYIEAAWALSYISDGDSRMPSVASEKLIHRCAALLRDSRVEVKVPALRLIGNFCSGDDDIAACVLATKCFDEIPAMLQNVNVKVRKETNWMISNIAAGPDDQVSWLLGTGFLPLCTPALSQEFTVRKEAIWVFKNISDIANAEQLWYLINDCHFLEPFIATLDIADKRMVLPILDSVSYLVHHGQKIAEMQGQDNPIMEMLNRMNIQHKLQGLCVHVDTKVSREAQDVLYLFQEDDDDDYNNDDARNGTYADQYFNDHMNSGVNDGWEEDANPGN